MNTIRMMAGASLTALALAMGACRETRVAPQARPVADTASEVLLAVSDTAPAIGDTIRVTAMLAAKRDSAVRVVSFTARLRHDTTALEYVREASAADGAMRAVNPGAGLVRIAGVRVKGFDPNLFTLAFVVRQRGALPSLWLSFDRLSTADSKDLSAQARVMGNVILAPR